MRNQAIDLNDTTASNRFANIAKSASRGKPESPLRPVVLISHVLFAVFIVGFAGYYVDRMVQSLRQWADN